MAKNRVTGRTRKILPQVLVITLGTVIMPTTGIAENIAAQESTGDGRPPTANIASGFMPHPDMETLTAEQPVITRNLQFRTTPPLMKSVDTYLQHKETAGGDTINARHDTETTPRLFPDIKIAGIFSLLDRIEDLLDLSPSCLAAGINCDSESSSRDVLLSTTPSGAHIEIDGEVFLSDIRGVLDMDRRDDIIFKKPGFKDCISSDKDRITEKKASNVLIIHCDLEPISAHASGSEPRPVQASN